MEGLALSYWWALEMGLPLRLEIDSICWDSYRLFKTICWEILYSQR